MVHGRTGRHEDAGPADLRQTVGEVLRILVLRRWTFMVPFCLATSAAFVASHYVPRTYQATARFEQANDAVSVNLPPSLVTSSYSYLLSTLEEDIKSEEVLGPVLEDLGLLDPAPTSEDPLAEQERTAVIKALASKVNVSAWQRSNFRNVIELQYAGPDPTIMTQLLEGMKENYKLLVRRKTTEKLIDARDWYDAQAEEKRKLVEQIDKRITAVRVRTPGIDPANPEDIGRQLTSLDNQVANLRRSNSRLESQIAARREFLNNARALAAANTGGAAQVAITPAKTRMLQQALEQSEAKVANLVFARGMTEQHPDIIAEKKLQERYRRALAAQPAPQVALVGPPNPANEAARTFFGANTADDAWMPAVAQVEMDLTTLLEQRDLNNEEVAGLEERINLYTTLQNELVDQRQDYALTLEELDRARDEYETYRGLVDQCNQNLTVENSNRGILFTDVELPDSEPVPISPLAKTVLLLAVLGGLITAAVFVAMAELFDRRYRTSTQIARSLGLPILEGISEIVTATERRGLFIRRAVLIPVATALLLGLLVISGGASMMSLSYPDSYQRMMTTPRSAWSRIIGPSATAQGPDSEPPSV
ncbi:MAG: hypothetical protein ACE5GE_04240 [Phycisphaerae bacterium]